MPDADEIAAETQQAWYTLGEGAEALGLSYRTLRRRVDAGAVSATKSLHDGREVLVIAGSELARFASAEGRTLRHVARHATARQDGAPTADTGAPSAEVAARLAALERENADLRQLTAWLQRHTDNLQANIDTLLHALPPAPTADSVSDRQAPTEVAEKVSEPTEPKRRPWWRLW
jgi:DNA-binding transcriptional MerR regulator